MTEGAARDGAVGSAHASQMTRWLREAKNTFDRWVRTLELETRTCWRNVCCSRSDAQPQLTKLITSTVVWYTIRYNTIKCSRAQYTKTWPTVHYNVTEYMG